MGETFSIASFILSIDNPPAKKNGPAGGFFAQQMLNAQKQGAGFGQGKKKKNK